MERFVCLNGIENQHVTESLAATLGISSSDQLHYQAECISKVSQTISVANWIRLPFCSTLCAEALGAHPVLSLSGAWIKEPTYQKPEDLPLEPDWTQHRMTTMLDAVELLSRDEKRIAYNVEGPFTLLSALLPTNRIFTSLRKSSGKTLLQNTEDWICQYADLAIKRGAKLISFADPVATVDILGSRMFTEVYVPCLRHLLDRLQSEHPEVVIHLCGKLTQCLLDTGDCEMEYWYPDSCKTYGDALAAYCETRNSGMIGHFCLNYLDTKRPYISIINWNRNEEIT